MQRTMKYCMKALNYETRESRCTMGPVCSEIFLEIPGKSSKQMFGGRNIFQLLLEKYLCFPK